MFLSNLKGCLNTMKKKSKKGYKLSEETKEKLRIQEEARKGKPLLGICLGMQVLFERGFEGKEREGLGLLKGEIRKMEDPNVKIPHIGWNNLEKNHEDKLLEGLKEDAFVYLQKLRL